MAAAPRSDPAAASETRAIKRENSCGSMRSIVVEADVRKQHRDLDLSARVVRSRADELLERTESRHSLHVQQSPGAA